MATNSERINGLETQMAQLLGMMGKLVEAQTSTVPTVAQVVEQVATPVTPPSVVDGIDIAELRKALKANKGTAKPTRSAWSVRRADLRTLRKYELATNGKTQAFYDYTCDLRDHYLQGIESGDYVITDANRPFVDGTVCGSWAKLERGITPLPVFSHPTKRSEQAPAKDPTGDTAAHNVSPLTGTVLQPANVTPLKQPDGVYVSKNGKKTFSGKGGAAKCDAYDALCEQRSARAKAMIAAGKFGRTAAAPTSTATESGAPSVTAIAAIPDGMVPVTLNGKTVLVSQAALDAAADMDADSDE